MTWTTVTYIGDAAVMVPIALAIAVTLLSAREWLGALEWLALFGTGAFLVVCTKIAYMGWGIGIDRFDFTGISGHSMGATSVLSVSGYYLTRYFSRRAAITGALFGYCAGIVIGISRVILRDHSPSEVVVGCLLGGSIALAALTMIRFKPRSIAAPAFLVVSMVASTLTLHGQKAPSEQLTVKVALYLSGRSTPCTRETHCAR